MHSLHRAPVVTVTAVLLLAGCKDQSRTEPPTRVETEDQAGDAAGDEAPLDAGSPGAGDVAAGEPVAARLAGDVVLPVGWSGAGVLAERQERPPRGAPRWTRIAAEVTTRDQQRYLQATGRAARIRNASLAATTAEARARAELARWLATDTLAGSRVVDQWRDPRSGTCYARVALAVPQDWIPGRPLPREMDESTPPPAPATP